MPRRIVSNHQGKMSHLSPDIRGLEVYLDKTTAISVV